MANAYRSLLGLGFWTGCWLLAVAPARAQQADSHSKLPVPNLWLLYSTDARLSEKWGLHADAQIRRTRSVSILRQNQVRVGVNYHASPELILTAGYSYIFQYSADEAPQELRLPEHRLYEQALLLDDKGRVRVQHRYRLEQRRLLRPGETSPVYLNRARYQLRLSMPLRGSSVQPGTPYLAVSDEVLINFGRNVKGNGFDQNRAALTVGYQFTKATALEAGYLNQLLPGTALSPAQQRHVALVSLTFNPDLRPGAPPAPAPPATP